MDRKNLRDYDLKTGKSDFASFQKLLNRIFVFFLSSMCILVNLVLRFIGVVNWTFITVLFFVIISMICIKLKKETFSIYNLLFGASFSVILTANSSTPEILTGVLILIIIISGITTNLRFSLFLFFLDLIFLITIYINHLQNPDSYFILENSMAFVILFVFLSLGCSFIISKIILNTINEQNEQYIQDLEKSEKDLSISNMELENYIYKISHELKTPLVSIANFITLFLRKEKTELDEKSKHIFDRIEKNIEDMESLILNVLENYRIDHEDEKEKILELISLL